MTTAKVMAQALRIPVVGIPSLDLVAYPLRHTSRMIVAVLDARRREVFHARYRPVPGGVQRAVGLRGRPPADLVAELEAAGEEVLLVGDGALAYRRSSLGSSGPSTPGRRSLAPSAAALVELATARVEREEFEAPWDVASALPSPFRRRDRVGAESLVRKCSGGSDDDVARDDLASERAARGARVSRRRERARQ